MSHEKQCPQCGADLPADAPQELCPKCLMKMGLPTGVEIDKPSTEGIDGDAAPQSTPGAFSPPEPAELAEQFPQLQILQLLGQGGMGAVYKAAQTALDRPVALKILPPQVGQDPAFAERFTREARAMAKLNHTTSARLPRGSTTSLWSSSTAPTCDMSSAPEKSHPKRPWPSYPRYARPCSTPTKKASSTVTSSPKTCCWTKRPG